MGGEESGLDEIDRKRADALLAVVAALRDSGEFPGRRA